MFAYVFLVHHSCSYVDGCAIINAKDITSAISILKNTTWRDMIRPGEKVRGSDDYLKEKLVSEGDKILDHYPEELPKEFPSYGNVWCVYAKLRIQQPAKEGVVAAAYHDG